MTYSQFDSLCFFDTDCYTEREPGRERDIDRDRLTDMYKLSETTSAVCVYMVSELLIELPITDLIPGRNYFPFSQQTLVACCSLSSRRTLREFLLHVNMSTDTVMVEVLFVQLFI